MTRGGEREQMGDIFAIYVSKWSAEYVVVFRNNENALRFLVAKTFS